MSNSFIKLSLSIFFWRYFALKKGQKMLLNLVAHFQVVREYRKYALLKEIVVSYDRVESLNPQNLICHTMNRLSRHAFRLPKAVNSLGFGSRMNVL